VDLSGKVALVTGAGRGIGRVIALTLAERGARVMGVSRTEDDLRRVAAEAPIQWVAESVATLAGCERIVNETIGRLGPVDILVNNSATNIGQGPSLAVTDEMLDKMVEINVKSALRLVLLTVPKMIERKRGGSVINIASIAGLQPQSGGLLYSFTKAGLIMMTRTWAREFGPDGVRVNAIAPGLIQTDFSEYLDNCHNIPNACVCIK